MENFTEMAKVLGIEVSSEQAKKFEIYMRELKSYNSHTNLTAITDDRGIMIKHFIDSLFLLKAVDIPMGASMADIGAGAGFPGLPVLIMRPDIKLTAMDSVNKRITFLKHITGMLEIKAELVHIRAEDAGRKPEYRDSFDVVTARAVAYLPKLLEYCMPLVRVGGCFAAMKGPGAAIEIEESSFAIERLGGKLLSIWHGQLPDGDERNIIMIKKVRKTDKLYPRTAKEIKDKQLTNS